MHIISEGIKNHAIELCGWPDGRVSDMLDHSAREGFYVIQLLFAVWVQVSGEGNDTVLQYSCLENPIDGGAWKAAVHGVAEGRT